MKARSALAIFACALSIYAGSYVYLSIELGGYGPEFRGSLMDGPPVYGWQLRSLRHDNAWYQRRNLTLVFLYYPLLILDRTVWHPTLDKAPTR